ncbi:MAG: class I SAM-dependent methyltransferase [Planctomycetota bacterium]|nr:class I SAM-dependent methyltransferase [Planctomycetota bacterium]
MRNGDLQSCRRVLDIGCGPGINAPFFEHADYTGLDWNDRYISDAQRRYGRNFISADARTFQPSPGQEFDFVLANSFFHHIDDGGVDSILKQLGKSVSSDGHIHILDLVLPEQPGIGRWLAINDRGDFARPLPRWEELFTRHFAKIEFEPFSLNLLGLGLWQMVYFKGKPRPVEDSLTAADHADI